MLLDVLVLCEILTFKNMLKITAFKLIRLAIVFSVAILPFMIHGFEYEDVVKHANSFKMSVDPSSFANILYEPFYLKISSSDTFDPSVFNLESLARPTFFFTFEFKGKKEDLGATFDVFDPNVSVSKDGKIFLPQASHEITNMLEMFFEEDSRFFEKIIEVEMRIKFKNVFKNQPLDADEIRYNVKEFTIPNEFFDKFVKAHLLKKSMPVK